MAEQNKIPELGVDSGIIYDIPVNDNGNIIGHISFNPSDFDILKRYDEVVDIMNNYEISENPTDEELFKLSDTIKELTDRLIGFPVSDVLFGHCNPCTPNGKGEFFFENVWNGLKVLIETTMNQRVEKKLKKIKAATSKYHK